MQRLTSGMQKSDKHSLLCLHFCDLPSNNFDVNLNFKNLIKVPKSFTSFGVAFGMMYFDYFMFPAVGIEQSRFNAILISEAFCYFLTIQRIEQQDS